MMGPLATVAASLRRLPCRPVLLGVLAASCLIHGTSWGQGQQAANQAAARREPANGAQPGGGLQLPGFAGVGGQPKNLDDLWRNFGQGDGPWFGKLSEAERRRLEAVEISPREETRQGRTAVRGYLAELRQRDERVVERGPEVEYLQRLVAVLKPQMRHDRRYRAVQVHVVKSPRIDARSFPGGFLFFFEGMLEMAESEAALVGVVAHELSHLDRQHQLRTSKEWKLAGASLAGQGDADWSQRASLMARMFSRPLHPEDEAQADEDAVRWSYRAGYDPRELARIFTRMQRRGPQLAEVLPEFLRTHPLNEERLRAVLARYDQLQRDEPRLELYIGRENLRRLTSRDQQRFE